MASWVDEELAGCKFADVRLDKRFRTLVERLSEGVGETIPMACQDWANTKAAYRFLSNPRVGEDDILAGHFQSTRDRFRSANGLPGRLAACAHIKLNRITPVVSSHFQQR